MTDGEARTYFERLLWPNGEPVCPRCGSADAYRMQGMVHRAGLCNCRECGRQFSVMIGTIMEDSRLPLASWALALDLMGGEGISANQLQKRAGIGSYRTAWFLWHRINLASMNAISKDKEQRIREMLLVGSSLRDVARAVGVAKQTVMRRAKPVGPDRSGRTPSGPTRCDHCGGPVPRDREFNRRTRRTKHKFCGHPCYVAFYRTLRRSHQCRRCGASRAEFLCATFVRGYCPKCYGVMRQFGFDEAAASAYELTQSLKKEIRNVQGKPVRKEHRRPSPDAHQDHRRSPVGHA